MTLIDGTAKIDWKHNKDGELYTVKIDLENGSTIEFRATELDMMGMMHVFSHILYEKTKVLEQKKEKKRIKSERKAIGFDR